MTRIKSANIRQHVADTLLDKIASGQLLAGQRMPTEMSLASEFNVSRGTVRLALQQLARQGVVELRSDVGSFVHAEALQAIAPHRQARHFYYVHPRERAVYPEILFGLERAAKELGGRLSLLDLTDDMGENQELLDSLARQALGGIIFTPFVEVNAYELNSGTLDLLEKLRLRYVVIDTPVEKGGMIRGDFVGSDGYSAMREVVRHLTSLGHRNIGSIRVFKDVYSSNHRFLGIIEELQAQNLPLVSAWHQVVEDIPMPEQGRARIREIMSLAERPTAVICNHDVIAVNVFDELMRMGFRVPDDVSVFGFDNTQFSALLRIASVEQPLAGIARQAIEMLLNPSSSKRQVFLPCCLVSRSSVKSLISSVSGNG